MLNQGALVPVTLGGSHPLGKTALYEGDAYVIQYAVRCHHPISNTALTILRWHPVLSKGTLLAA